VDCSPKVLGSAARCWCLPIDRQRGAWIYLLCLWLKKKPSPPPVARFSYEPPTALISWTDVNGNFGPVDRATFFATADIASVSFVQIQDHTLTSIVGLQLLPELDSLLVAGNPGLTSVDVTNCQLLTYLDCTNCGLTSLLIGGCPILDTLICPINSLSVLDASGLGLLTILRCSNNSLTSLNLTGCVSLLNLQASTNQLTVLSVNNTLNSLVSSGVTGGNCLIDMQTPAAPPSVGPPNGIVAKAALLAEIPPWFVLTD
jgi:hypothetical protein